MLLKDSASLPAGAVGVWRCNSLGREKTTPEPSKGPEVPLLGVLKETPQFYRAPFLRRGGGGLGKLAFLAVVVEGALGGAKVGL